jgi:ABC-type uncharacterized transport system permease subunit
MSSLNLERFWIWVSLNKKLELVFSFLTKKLRKNCICGINLSNFAKTFVTFLFKIWIIKKRKEKKNID